MEKPYIDKEGLISRFGKDEILKLEENLESTSSITAAIIDATSEVNSYLSVRYRVPLPLVPSVIANAVANIARYRLYQDAPTDEVTVRYKRTISLLEAFAAGDVWLVGDNGEGSPLASPTKQVLAPQATSSTPVFTQEMFKKMPDLWGIHGIK